MTEDDRPGDSGTPYMNPVDRFWHLPEPTRRFLEELREDDIKKIRRAVEFYDKATTIGGFFKWALWSTMAAFVLASQFGEATQRFWDWIKRALHP